MRRAIFSRWLTALAASTCLAGAALAADKPRYAPPPAWVQEKHPKLAVPAGETMPVRVLYSGQQLSLQPGAISTFTHFAVHLGTPQGLAAGNLSFLWRPETDTLTFHRILIHRGDAVIDVLGKGQKFTILRREQNLENATLDGVLTATLQPEGLQVGDILEVAMTMESRDPVLKGHVEQLAALWNGVPFERAELRVRWPASLPLRFRPIGDIPAPAPVRDGDQQAFEIAFDNLRPILAPSGAPMRFQFGRGLEISDYASWADIARLMLPLYAKAARIPSSGPLRAEVNRIRALSPDKRVQAEAALALVQDRIRYVALAMGEGGLVPADAETTWSRRFGDCKAKTALLIGLLSELGIAADPVLVNTVAGDGLDARLPIVGLFNHVIVRASIDGKSYWMDGTRMGDGALDRLKTPNYGWGLPVVRDDAALVRMQAEPLTTPDTVSRIEIDARKGIDSHAPAKAAISMRGDAAQSMRLMLSAMPPEARDRGMRQYWRSRYNFIEIGSVSENFDEKTGEQQMSMEGMATMDWNNGYEVDVPRLGFNANFSRDPGPGSDAPFAVPFPSYERTTETILLPAGFRIPASSMPADVDENIAGRSYKRQVRFADVVYTAEVEERALVPEIPLKEATASQARLRALYAKGVYIPKPAQQTNRADDDTTLRKPPVTKEDYSEQAAIFEKRGDVKQASLLLDKAVRLYPADAGFRNRRAEIFMLRQDYASAAADLDAAEKTGTEAAWTLANRGRLAMHQGKFEQARTLLSKAIAARSDYGYAYQFRGFANAILNNYAEALSDFDKAIANDAGDISMRAARADLLFTLNRNDEAAKQFDALADEAVGNADFLQQIARTLQEHGYREKAVRAYGLAIEAGPDSMAYVGRSEALPADRLVQRKKDLTEALKLDPTNKRAIRALAEVQMAEKNYAAAVSTLTDGLNRLTGLYEFQNLRGVAYALAGQKAAAEKDFAAAHANPAIAAAELAEICGTRAMWGVDVRGALADCDAAVKMAPDDRAAHNARGFALVRLERHAEAGREFTRALDISDGFAPAWFGRALVEARLGRAQESQAALAKAREITPDIAEWFALRGISL